MRMIFRLIACLAMVMLLSGMFSRVVYCDQAQCACCQKCCPEEKSCHQEDYSCLCGNATQMQTIVIEKNSLFQPVILADYLSKNLFSYSFLLIKDIFHPPKA